MLMGGIVSCWREGHLLLVQGVSSRYSMPKILSSWKMRQNKPWQGTACRFCKRGNALEGGQLKKNCGKNEGGEKLGYLLCATEIFKHKNMGCPGVHTSIQHDHALRFRVYWRRPRLKGDFPGHESTFRDTHSLIPVGGRSGVQRCI